MKMEYLNKEHPNEIDEDAISIIESEVALQLSAEAYNMTENIENHEIQYTSYKLLRDIGVRGMRLTIQKLMERGIIQ